MIFGENRRLVREIIREKCFVGRGISTGQVQRWVGPVSLRNKSKEVDMAAAEVLQKAKSVSQGRRREQPLKDVQTILRVLGFILSQVVSHWRGLVKGLKHYLIYILIGSRL